jgi:hypothetical protein
MSHPGAWSSRPAGDRSEVLIRGLGDVVAAGGRLALIRPNTTVWKVFVLTGRSHNTSRQPNPLPAAVPR